MYGYGTKKTVRNITLAVFCAMAYASEWIFHFKVAFLSFDMKDSIIAIAAMIFGPAAALVMGVLVAFIELVTMSDTGIYGLIMNIISTCVFTGISSLIYKYKRTLSGAVCGLVCSCFATTAVMALTNLLITPFYMKTSVDVVLAMLPTTILPFNFIKYVFNAGVVMLLYKPVTNALRYSGVLKKSPVKITCASGAEECTCNDGNDANTKNSTTVSSGNGSAKINWIVMICALAVIVASIVVITLVLGGSIEVGK